MSAEEEREADNATWQEFFRIALSGVAAQPGDAGKIVDHAMLIATTVVAKLKTR